MSFDKNGVVRQARTSNKEQFDSAASMARTRENATEFSRAAKAGKLLRQALRKQIQGAADALDKRERRTRDAAAGLVPFACKLPAALAKRLQDRAAAHAGGINALVAELLEQALPA